MPDIQLTVAETPLSSRPFQGLGVQVDGVLYNDQNRQSGVDDDAYALLEERLRTLRPALARMFFRLDAIVPSLDPAAIDRTSPEYVNNLRMLRVLADAGAQVNAVLFEPYRIENARLDDAVRCMVALLAMLRDEEGCGHIRWLTLYNEPESAFPHDSPLMRRVFGAKVDTAPHRWEDFVRINLLAERLLAERGLPVRVSAPDCVWGAPVRRERMALAAESFHGHDITYGCHNYSPEAPAFYENGNPDYRYAGMEEEMAHFRTLVGDMAELVVWEFNLSGEGFGSYFPGVDEEGCHVLETPSGGARIAEKVCRAIRGGADGLCVWCFSDMHYYADNHKQGVMRFGLSRYRWENWTLRPYAHYFSALCGALRPGARFLAVEGLAEPLSAVACDHDGTRTLALVNASSAPQPVTVISERGFAAGRELVLTPDRIGPRQISPASPASPASAWQTTDACARLSYTLAPHELRLIEWVTA